jgi:hypothetical protein
MRRITGRGWAFLVVTALLALVAAFLPDLVGAGWRLIYGPSVRFKDWEIRVPRGWFAIHQGEGVTVERMVHLALWQVPPTAVFLPVHVLQRFVFEQQVWQQQQVAIQAARGYQFNRGHAEVVAGKPGYCWEFSAAKDPRRLWVTCLFPADRISVDFSGTPAYLPAFYSILPAITRESQPQGPAP